MKNMSKAQWIKNYFPNHEEYKENCFSDDYTEIDVYSCDLTGRKKMCYTNVEIHHHTILHCYLPDTEPEFIQLMNLLKIEP